MSVIRFTKMQGLGNDYIYVNVMECPISNPEQFSIRWSDRRKGIGSDGLIMIGKSAIADFSMRIFNADGSEARMCGNGARCVGKYLHDKGLTDKTEIRLETLSGIKILKLHLAKDGTVDTVTVNMGQGLPLKVNHGSGTLVGETLNVGEGPTVCSAIDMGNPHLVMFVTDAEKARVDEVGPFMEHHSMFPDRANIEFAQVLDRKHIRMRVWERGSGITFACGTGACATAVASAMQGYTDADGCDVIMDGGTLTVQWDPATKEVLMTGAAEFVFDGTVTE
ncbi:MAG: diaminopimelate epimerase [Bacteroidaceae bacterium]|nr:diaminopimelate epimerase [Bacteroidaceae bacterium]